LLILLLVLAKATEAGLATSTDAFPAYQIRNSGYQAMEAELEYGRSGQMLKLGKSPR
jgi:hypothetical protein